MKTKTIVLISATVAILGTGLYFAFRKKKPIEDDEDILTAEPIPFFQINSVKKNDAGFVYSVDYTFQDVRDTYNSFDNPYTVEPYATKKSSYSLSLSTNEKEGDGYGLMSFDLFQNGKFVKNLYKTT